MQPENTPRAASPTVILYGQEGGGEALADALALDGFDVRLVSDPAQLGEADLIVFAHTPEPGARLGALRALRQGQLAGSGARILWISQGRDHMDTLRAFQVGADDVIRAPFVYAELVARLRALLRRDRPDTSPLICHGALAIDTTTYTAAYDGTPVGLRRLEYQLLAHLARDPHRVHTKHELLRAVWGYRSDGATRTVDTHASRVRRKLAQAGARGWVISHWGVGYCLAPQPSLTTTGGSHGHAR
jgi:DNA-binding response OmpR family regulator